MRRSDGERPLDVMIISVLTVAILGFLPALLLVRSLTLARALASAIAVVVASLGAIIGVAFGTSIVLSTVLIAVATDIASIAWLIYRRPTFSELRSRSRFGAQAADAGFILVPTLMIYWLHRPLPLGWDPRSIWWFHATLFLHGGPATLLVNGNPSYGFNHGNYPPGASSVAATAWWLAGGKNLLVAETLTSLLTTLSITFLVLIVIGRRTAFSYLLGFLFAISITGLGLGYSAYGYVGILCATLMASSLVAFLAIPDHRTSLILGALLLCAATLVKGEALIFGGIVLVVAFVFKHNARRILVLAGVLAMLPSILWQALIFRNTHSVSGDFSLVELSKLFESDHRAKFRFAYLSILHATWPLNLAAVIVLLVAIGVFTLRFGRRRMWSSLMPAVGMVVVALTFEVTTAVVYASGAPWKDMYLWMDNSLEREIAFPQILLIASVVACTLALATLFKRSDVDRDVTAFTEVPGREPLTSADDEDASLLVD